MKVVFIDTIYVETDELQFKLIVQKFTGKCPLITGDFLERVHVNVANLKQLQMKIK